MTDHARAAAEEIYGMTRTVAGDMSAEDADERAIAGIESIIRRHMDADRKRLVEMLRELEWSADSLNGDAICPECGHAQPSSYNNRNFVKDVLGHANSCELAALLKEVSGE
jgi:hypothetical protein